MCNVGCDLYISLLNQIISDNTIILAMKKRHLLLRNMNVAQKTGWSSQLVADNFTKFRWVATPYRACCRWSRTLALRLDFLLHLGRKTLGGRGWDGSVFVGNICTLHPLQILDVLHLFRCFTHRHTQSLSNTGFWTDGQLCVLHAHNGLRASHGQVPCCSTRCPSG